MSGKRGRKCSIKTCDSYQHTHKHLSFFRFPKEPERCRIWIEKTNRYDLLEKTNVHEERICQLHFEPSAFINESRNRLHQSAYPMLFLTNECDSTNDDMTFNGIPLSLFNDHRLLNMTKQELLYHAQMAAANNLTITAVPNIQPNTVNESFAFAEPLNLSKASINSTQTLDDSSLLNKTEQFNDSNDESKLVIQSPMQSMQPMQLSQLNGNTKTVQPTPTNGTNFSNSRRARQIFTQGQEEQLAVYVRETSNYYSGLSSKEVRIMAYVWGVCNQVEMPPGWHESHQASFDWCVGFIKRTKLPPTMITGISTKGKSKSSMPNSNNGTTPLPDSSRISIDNQNSSNATPIEID